MMNIGDKLTCKEEFKEYSTHTVIFYKDVEYDILYIDNYTEYHHNNIQVLVGLNINYDTKFWFYICDVHKYFYTDKEVRMIKLERLEHV